MRNVRNARKLQKVRKVEKVRKVGKSACFQVVSTGRTFIKSGFEPFEEGTTQKVAKS